MNDMPKFNEKEDNEVKILEDCVQPAEVDT